MFMVYWSTMGPDGALTPHAQEYQSNDMNTAMADMEQLRKQRREGGSECFITFISENPDCVGQAGVDVTGPGYKDQWDKKHRGGAPEPGVVYRTR